LGQALAASALAAIITVYAVVILSVEDQWTVIALLAAGVVVAALASRTGFLSRAGTTFTARRGWLESSAVVGALAVILYFHQDHFALLMIATVMIYASVCLGLNIQLGFTGILNFAGAAFFGVGAYTAALLTDGTGVPPVVILFIGGAAAAVIGCLLIWPVLRTRGHYAALVTIAFAILFKTFLEVNDTLGGPQGLIVGAFSLFGWSYNDPIPLGEAVEPSFYLPYALTALVLLVLAFALTRRIERSWIGVNLDAVRLDETAAACFGISIARWKITAFTIGNFVAGMAGALYGTMIGFIAPANFSFSDSLIFVSIVLLGGLGSAWGMILAAAIVVVLPEKLQVIQEYRFLLFSVVVILILLFRPSGLIPRRARVYFPGR